MAGLLRFLPDPACAHEPGSGSAEDYARIFGRSGRTSTTASTNCAIAANQSSMQRSLPFAHRVLAHVRTPGGPTSTAQPTTPIRSVSLDFMFLMTLNLVEPPGT